MTHPMSPTRPRRFRWLLPLAVLGVLGVLAAVLLPRLRGGQAAPQATATVQLGDVEKTVTSVGSLQPREYVDVGTQVSGRVLQVHVDINDRVTKGQLIAELDSNTFEAIVASDRANIENLQAQINQQKAEAVLARQQLKRNLNMAASRAVSQDTVDQAEAALAVADAQVLATQAQLKAAQATLQKDLTNLGYTKIYSPMDGTVVSQTTLEGQTVNANQSTPVIVQVAQLDVMTVWAQVTEADINKITPGMTAWFNTLGMPDRRFTGTVWQVQPTPEVTNDVVLYNVLVDVDNPDGVLLPQMTVQAFFVLGEARNVPVVPMNALRPDRRAGPNRYTATVLTPNGSEERQVTVGLSSRMEAEVKDGLKPGEEVVLPVASGEAAARTQGQARIGRPGMTGPRL